MELTYIPAAEALLSDRIKTVKMMGYSVGYLQDLWYNEGATKARGKYR